MSTVWKYSEFFYSGFTNILCSKFLLTRTLQSNLDLLGKHSDLELWEVLELHDLKDFVQSLPKKLLHEMSEGCENLRVPVMDAGRILEYDTPQNLLQRKGAFFEIVAEAGIRR